MPIGAVGVAGFYALVLSGQCYGAAQSVCEVGPDFGRAVDTGDSGDGVVNAQAAKQAGRQLPVSYLANGPGFGLAQGGVAATASVRLVF